MLLREDSPSSKDCKGILLAREQVHCEAFKSAPTASKLEGLRVFPQTPQGTGAASVSTTVNAGETNTAPSCRERLTVSVESRQKSREQGDSEG